MVNLNNRRRYFNDSLDRLCQIAKNLTAAILFEKSFYRCNIPPRSGKRDRPPWNCFIARFAAARNETREDLNRISVIDHPPPLPQADHVLCFSNQQKIGMLNIECSTAVNHTYFLPRLLLSPPRGRVIYEYCLLHCPFAKKVPKSVLRSGRNKNVRKFKLNPITGGGEIFSFFSLLPLVYLSVSYGRDSVIGFLMGFFFLSGGDV